MKLIYQHKVTKEKIQLWKLTPSLWYRLENDQRIFMKYKDLKQYKFLKNESNTGGWKTERGSIFGGAK